MTAPHTATPVVWVAVSIASMAIANARARVQKTLRTATPDVWVAVLFFLHGYPFFGGSRVAASPPHAGGENLTTEARKPLTRLPLFGG